MKRKYLKRDPGQRFTLQIFTFHAPRFTSIYLFPYLPFTEILL